MGNCMGVPIACRARSQDCWLSKGHIFKVRIYNKDHPTGEPLVVSIDLDHHIGITGSFFDVTKKHVTRSTRNVYLEGFTLHGDVDYKATDGLTRTFKRSINLNLFLGVCGNELTFHKPSTNIGDSGSLFFLESKTLYSAFCLKSDGMLQYSYIDLDEYLENKDGKFVAGGKHYSRSSMDVHLDDTGLILRGKLQNHKKEWVDASFDLSTVLSNVGGYLDYKTPDKGFDRNAMLTQFFESVPYIGWLTVAGHLRANNPNHAKRAVARTVYATIVFAAGATGAIVGGGPIGLAIGAGIGTIIGMAAEGIIRLSVTDETVDKDFDEITVMRIIKESVVNIISAELGAYLGKVVSKASMNAVAEKIQDELLKKVQARLTEEGVSAVSGHTFSTAFSGVREALEESAESNSSSG